MARREATKQPLSPADTRARLASLRRQVAQLEVDLGMGLFENKREDYESLVAEIQAEIRVLEASL